MLRRQKAAVRLVVAGWWLAVGQSMDAEFSRHRGKRLWLGCSRCVQKKEGSVIVADDKRNHNGTRYCIVLYGTRARMNVP
jgi:hypothetical protein